MAEPALTVRGLSARLGGRVILHEVEVSAERAAVTAILGPNGAGKTTLLECMAGLLPYSGAIAVSPEVAADGDGAGAGDQGVIDLAQLSVRERAQRVAYVPQRSALDAPLAVATVVGHGRYAHAGSSPFGQGGAERARAERAIIERAMVATDVLELAERSYLELSGGEQRRVLIARALATGARVILLDEPTASLDIGHALALFQLLRELAESGVCVIVVLHDLNDALAYADHAVLIDHGRVAASGPAAEVIADEPIRRVYGVEPVHETRLGFKLVTS